ncbi:hypothetical protein RFI_28906, partial [Reticulomyxa filosa]
ELKKLCATAQINYDELTVPQSQSTGQIQVEQTPKSLPKLEKSCCGSCCSYCNTSTPQKQIQYYLEYREHMAKKIQEQLTHLSLSSTAFVHFHTRQGANLCLSAPIRFGLIELRISKASRPEDVLWENVGFEEYQVQMSRVGVNLAMVALLLFWSIPSTAIQGLANIQPIFERGGINLNHVLGAAFVSWLEGFLSILLLNVWLSLVPVIISNLKKYFDCLLVMLVLVTAVCGTILKNLETLQWQLEPFIKSMAYGLSQMSVYFMMYLLHQGLFDSVLELFRFGYWVSKWTVGSIDNTFYFAWTYPLFMIALTLAITYGAMSPLIWIFALLYFAIGYFIVTYQLSMCYINTNEIGLQLWPSIFNRLIIGIEIGNITVLAFVSLSEGIGPSVVMLFLIFLVYWVWKKMDQKFERLFHKRDTRFAHQSDELSSKHRRQALASEQEEKTSEDKSEIIGIGTTDQERRNLPQDPYIAPVLKKYRQ